MRKTNRVLIVMLLIASFISTPIAMAAAPHSPQSNAYISSFASKVSATGNGQIKIEFETGGTGTMGTIGASVIKVYNQNGWVYTFNMSNLAYTSKMVGNNTTSFYGSVTYDGVSGNTYYAVVTHYAAKEGGSGTEVYTTNSVVA